MENSAWSGPTSETLPLPAPTTLREAGGPTAIEAAAASGICGAEASSERGKRHGWPVTMGETPIPPAQPVTMGETPIPPAQPVRLGAVAQGRAIGVIGRAGIVALVFASGFWARGAMGDRSSEPPEVPVDPPRETLAPPTAVPSAKLESPTAVPSAKDEEAPRAFAPPKEAAKTSTAATAAPAITASTEAKERAAPVAPSPPLPPAPLLPQRPKRTRMF
jgi:hypothetical protein